jgi:hypothetical protein
LAQRLELEARGRVQATVERRTAGETGGTRDKALETASTPWLSAAGCEPTSISKYRLGVGLLLADDPESAHNQALRNCFS